MPPRKKKKNKALPYVIAGVVLLVLFAVYASMSTTIRYGSVKYGICRIILEKNVPFPQTLQLARVIERAKYVRILYSHIDSFGQYRYSSIQCDFEQDQDYANRQWLISQLAALETQGISMDQVIQQAGVNKEILFEYLSRKRGRLPDAGTIERIASALGVPAPGPVFVLDSIKVDGRSFPQETIDSYQKILPVMAANPPDLSLPPPLPRNIADYKRK